MIRFCISSSIVVVVVVVVACVVCECFLFAIASLFWYLRWSFLCIFRPAASIADASREIHTPRSTDAGVDAIVLVVVIVVVVVSEICVEAVDDVSMYKAAGEVRRCGRAEHPLQFFWCEINGAIQRRCDANRLRAQENFVFRSRPCCVAARSGNLRWVGEYKSLVRGPDR